MEDTANSDSPISIQTLDRIRAEISRTKGWLKFLAVLSFVMAPVSVLSSFLRMVLSPAAGGAGLIGGVISAGVSILLAVFLLVAANKGKAYAGKGQAGDLIAYHGKLAIYFTISGVLIIVVLAGLVIGSILLVTTGVLQSLL